MNIPFPDSMTDPLNLTGWKEREGVWIEKWNGFKIYVVKRNDLFDSIIKTPWSETGIRFRTSQISPDEARARCFKMIQEECEHLALMAGKWCGSVWDNDLYSKDGKIPPV